VGIAESIADQLAAEAQNAKANNQVLGANDPNVDTVRIIVEA
jgi:hypothetical protein